MRRKKMMAIRWCPLLFCFMLFRFEYCIAQSAPAVYVFGDSLVDVGNNNHLPISIAKSDFPHNGIDFPTKKATGRFSNGKNAADFLAVKLGIPTSPPYLSLKSKFKKVNASAFVSGVSFASGGAGIFNGTDNVLSQSLPLTKQVEYYSLVYQEIVKQLGAAAAQTHLSKSVFAVVIGSNDVFGYHDSNSKARKASSPQQYSQQMVTLLQTHINRIHSLGARKFVITGIGPVGCCPSERNKNKDACNEDANSLAQMYNEAVKSMLQNLSSTLQPFYYSYFDTYKVLNSFIQNPADHGFKEVRAACCGLGNLNADLPCLPIATYCPNRKDHVFWDLYHPTEAAASLFVDYIYDGPQTYTFPINVKQLVAI
uniref:GDSL esterase/lipase n=1 Tax=Kalanchoe fedtschenkoi TaxID=63787 RepID=A0A7N0UWB8_KALFE